MAIDNVWQVEVLQADDVHAVVEAMRGSFVQMSRQRTANHAVQRLLERVEGLPQVRLILQELSAHIAELLQWNRPGVVRSLADMCARTQEGQGDLVKAVAKAMNLAAPQDHPRLVPALLVEILKKQLPFSLTVCIYDSSDF